MRHRNYCVADWTANDQFFYSSMFQIICCHRNFNWNFSESSWHCVSFIRLWGFLCVCVFKFIWKIPIAQYHYGKWCLHIFCKRVYDAYDTQIITINKIYAHTYQKSYGFKTKFTEFPFEKAQSNAKQKNNQINLWHSSHEDIPICTSIYR